MKKLFLLLFLGFLVICTFVSSVSAQLPYFTVNFDRLYYYMGEQGAVEVKINTDEQAYDIRDMGFQLLLNKNDGEGFVTELFFVNYTDTPLQLSAYDNATVIINFTTPIRNDLVTDIIRYVFYVNLRPQGTTTYSEESSGEQYATSFDTNCVLISSETTPTPTPTTEPTVTPTPTSTPTSTPTPTATPTSTPTPTPTPPAPVDFSLIVALFGAAIVIIAVLLVIILIMLRRGKK